MDGSDLAALTLAAYLTATLSAIVGMAGGLVLLTILLLYLDPLVAIPLHGAIQLISNGTRSVIQRRHVRWRLVWRYGLLMVPTSLAGLSVARVLAPGLTRRLIGGFVLLATWRPGWLTLGTHPERVRPERRFILLGAVVGFLQMTIGATGPLIAPFFLNLGLDRRGVVGTKAAAQTLGHSIKILVFGAFGFAYRDHALLLVCMCAGVVAGTWTGSRLLERVSEAQFRLLFKTVLTLIALRLVLAG
ncbi:MAG: sulfite exporter TauE/SafE family protein [Myxococcota bacterium]